MGGQETNIDLGSARWSPPLFLSHYSTLLRNDIDIIHIDIRHGKKDTRYKDRGEGQREVVCIAY